MCVDDSVYIEGVIILNVNTDMALCFVEGVS